MRGQFPKWLSRVALAESCSGDAIAVAAASAGERLSTAQAAGLLPWMESAGLLVQHPDRSETDARALRPEVRDRMLEELSHAPGGIAATRRELLAAGLADPSGRLGPQLARWAVEAEDWRGLAKVWETHRSSDLVTDTAARAVYRSVAPHLRAIFPQLSFAAALAGAYDPDADRLDLDALTAALIRDGSTLHSDWERKEGAEAKLLAGTIRMLALATIPASFQDPAARSSTAYEELSQMVRTAAVSGDPVSAKALTFFHSTASLVAILRGDWARARREGEYAMILSDLCSFPGFLAALVVASSSAVSGDTHHSPVTARFLATHAAHDCVGLAWLDPVFHLVEAEAAIRRLDREHADQLLRLQSAEETARRWINVRAMQVTVTRTAAILWGDPQRALAHFDSIIDDVSFAADDSGPWKSLLLRCRAELLITLGETNRAGEIIEHLLAHADDSVSAAPSAWLYLCAGDFARALAKADAGIFELRVGLADRAFLYAVKSAALHQAGAPEQLVASAAAAACEVCERGDTLVPFAALPSAVRAHLLAHHGQHHGTDDCFVTRAVARGAFDGLRDVVSRAPVRLTRREQVLLPLLASSATVQEIADQQYVSVNTVRKQVVALREKVGASSRSDLIRRAEQLGWLDEAKGATRHQ